MSERLQISHGFSSSCTIHVILCSIVWKQTYIGYNNKCYNNTLTMTMLLYFVWITFPTNHTYVSTILKHIWLIFTPFAKRYYDSRKIQEILLLVRQLRENSHRQYICFMKHCITSYFLMGMMLFSWNVFANLNIKLQLIHVFQCIWWYKLVKKHLLMFSIYADYLF